MSCACGLAEAKHAKSQIRLQPSVQQLWDPISNLEREYWEDLGGVAADQLFAAELEKLFLHDRYSNSICQFSSAKNRIDDCTWLHYTSQDPTKTPALDLHNVSAEYSPHLLTLSHATLKVGKSILPICKICWIWKVHGVKMANNGRWNPQLHHLY